MTSCTMSRPPRVDAPLLVHAPQLERLPSGLLAERGALHVELALHELALRRHGEILPAAMENAPATRPATPTSRTTWPPGLAPATPSTKECW